MSLQKNLYRSGRTFSFQFDFIYCAAVQAIHPLQIFALDLPSNTMRTRIFLIQRKVSLTLLLLCILTGFLNAQTTTYKHKVFWGRLVLTDTINSKLRWELLLQKRTQNANPESNNMFEANHFTSYWLWFSYSATDNLKIAVSPFGYFNNHIFNGKPDDINQPSLKEFRWCLRLEEKTSVRLFDIFNRQTIEYRTRDLKNNNQYIPNWRFRYMVRIEKNIISKPKPLTLSVSNEVFVQFGRAVRNNPNIFDQNRAYAGLSYEVVKNVKLSAGYLKFYQARSSGNEFDDANALWVILTLDNLFSQFRKDKV